MGADGHIAIVSKAKLAELLGEKDAKNVVEFAPGCIYERDFNGIPVLTFYWGDNLYSSFWCEDDWLDYLKGEDRAERLVFATKAIKAIQDATIATWEVWT